MSMRVSVLLILVVSLAGFASFEAKAGSESHSVVTERGVKLNIVIDKPDSPKSPLPLLVLAPGQTCSSSSDILDAAANSALTSGYAILRFRWSYCQSETPSTPSPLPSPFFVDEVDDLESALNFAKGNSEFDQERLVLGGKTQGSFVAYRVFVRQPAVRALALFSPVCTYTVDNENRPLPAPIMVGYENYPNLSLQRRPILFIAGSDDKSCLISALDDLLRETSPNVKKSVVNGDHAFRTFNDDGSVNETETSKNRESAAAALMNWLTLLTRVGR